MTKTPPPRLRPGTAVWLTRRQEDGSDLHYPCHVLSFNQLTGLYSLSRADARHQHTFAAPHAVRLRTTGEIAPGITPKTRHQAEIVETRR